ncbi:protein sickie-like [Apis mellifera caucasica]|nr:protein sickie-like [Apis mellifera caucasica]
MARQLSADSVTSLNSLSSACSASSHHKKKGWLRSSFSKAFSRSRKNRHGSVSDAEDCKENASGDLSAPNSPRLPSASKHESSRGGQNGRSNGQKSPEVENPLTGSKSSSALYKKEDEDVVELKKQLREKDLVLTDIRLEALSSAHQLESLKDTVIKMRNEMLNLKQNNERLQRLVTSKSLTSSQSSLPSDPDRRFSMTEVASTVAALSNGDTSTTADQLEDLNVPEHSVVPSTTSTTGEPTLEQDTDGKRINVAIYLGSEKNFNYNLVTGSTSDGSIGEPPHCIIANVCISNKTTWDSLDSTVRRCFKEYVSRVDPVTNLGLGVECVAAYHLGEASRVILCGPSGTGKSYLAGKLAHALVDADNDTKDATAVATFNVDHKSSKELRQYLAHIAERCDSNAADELPRVIILENLQHAASLGELFSGLLGTRHSSCPAIIGTMSQATCSTTNLQLHHNFRWVLCANHMEPVKGFLGRYLRRKLLEHELRECGGTRNAEMAAVVEWLPRVWLHLNKFLESHSSSDVTIGPRLFLSCPMEVTGSQVWFTDLWNYSVVPYLVEAVREGLTLYGRRVSGNGNGDSSWEDPAQFITSSYPWISTHAVHGGSDALLRLRPEDVGYDVVTSGHTSGVGASSVKSLGSTHSDTEGDPLVSVFLLNTFN